MHFTDRTKGSKPMLTPIKYLAESKFVNFVLFLSVVRYFDLSLSDCFADSSYQSGFFKKKR